MVSPSTTPTAPILIVEHDPNDPPSMVAAWLEDAGVPYDVLRPHAGDPHPADLSAYTGIIMLGGGQSAVSDKGFGWRSESLDLLRRAVAEERPLLAMCLGSQLLAQATGGKVERGSEGREVGAMLVGRKDASYGDELFDVLPMAPDVIQFHGEVISELPPGAVRLMGGPVYDNQAFRLGSRAWAIQFHIETTHETYARWLEEGRESLERHGFDVDRLLARSAAVHPEMGEVWSPFIRQFAAIAARDHAGR